MSLNESDLNMYNMYMYLLQRIPVYMFSRCSWDFRPILTLKARLKKQK